MDKREAVYKKIMKPNPILVPTDFNLYFNYFLHRYKIGLDELLFDIQYLIRYFGLYHETMDPGETDASSNISDE